MLRPRTTKIINAKAESIHLEIECNENITERIPLPLLNRGISSAIFPYGPASFFF